LVATKVAYAKDAPCNTCIIGGFEFVATKAADYKPTASAVASIGYCCVTGLYENDKSCKE
jgi:hypothetical protein